jgi:hypothetical protein
MKKELAPFVCDMSTWYLYSVCADSSIRESQDPPKGLKVLLPPCRHGQLCNLFSIGFDEKNGHKQATTPRSKKGSFVDLTGRVKMSFHFQGGSKRDISSIFFEDISNSGQNSTHPS